LGSWKPVSRSRISGIAGPASDREQARDGPEIGRKRLGEMAVRGAAIDGLNAPQAAAQATGPIASPG